MSPYPIYKMDTLLPQAVSGDVDPFVELALYDPATNSTDVLWSSQMLNEPNPKWGEKFDFTMISATSRLTINVWDKLNFFEGRFSIKGLTGAAQSANASADHATHLEVWESSAGVFVLP